MKNIIQILFLPLLFLLGLQMMGMTPLEEKEGDLCALQEDIPVAHLSAISQLPDAVTAFADAESLVRQFRVMGRNLRQLPSTYPVLSRWMNCKMVKCRMDVFLQSINHIYTSLPRPYWSVSSDHYVFAMRRILI